MESVDFAAAPAVLVDYDRALQCELDCSTRPYRCLLGSRRVVDAVLLVKSSVVVAVVSVNE